MDPPEDTSDDNEDDVQIIAVSNPLFHLATEVVPGNNSLSSNSESDDQTEEEGGGGARQFDTNIPTMHKYLGKLNTISGYSIFDDGECLTIIGIHTNTIVSPGFTLPLIMDVSSEQEIMKKCIKDKCVFAVVFENERKTQIFSYGIIMEVFESFIKHGTLYLKAKGRQRCKVLRNHEVRHLGGRLVRMTVKALAEPDIKSPVSSTQLLKLKAFRHFCYKDYWSAHPYCKYRKYHVAQFPYASWVYDHNEVYYMYKLVFDLLTKFYIREYIPVQPVQLSFWFLQNFQLTHEERLEILEKNSVLERLKLEYRFLLMERIMCCRVCRQHLADHKDIFAMSKDGVQSTYCNPGGHVYETVTVTQIRNYTLVGSPSKEFTWFPGYLWTITQCQTCRGHIGWKFTSKYLQPPSFFGLARANLDIKIINSADDNAVI